MEGALEIIYWEEFCDNEENWGAKKIITFHRSLCVSQDAFSCKWKNLQLKLFETKFKKFKDGGKRN